MPLSDADTGFDERTPGQNLAVIAESLFLGNLLVAPGICFAVLLWLWIRNKDDAPLLARQHLKQATYVSLWGGLLIVILSALFIAFGGLHWEWTWVLLIMYFTCVHSTLVCFGAYALSKALAGQIWRFPLIGPAIDRGPA